MLNILNKTYAFKAWFREKVLYVGPAYWPELQQSPPPKVTFNWNIIKHDLISQTAESVRLRVKAVSIQKDNSKVEVEVGDPEGDLRSLTYYNIPKKELADFTKMELERMRYTGYRGKFTTFGTPIVRHGDRVELVDRTIPDRNGLYIARSV